MQRCRQTSFLVSKGMQGAPCEGQLLSQVLACNLYSDLSIRAIRKLFAKDIQKLSDAGQAEFFTCLPTSYAEALNLLYNATNTVTFRILPFPAQVECIRRSRHYWSLVCQST